MKKVIISIIVLAVLGGAYWFFTKPNGTKCDCEVQSYYEANKNYCDNLSMQEPTPQSLEGFYSKINKSNCTHDFKTEVDSENGYIKYDAIIGYDDDDLPVWRPVLLKDDGKYPANGHIKQIKKAMIPKTPGKAQGDNPIDNGSFSDTRMSLSNMDVESHAFNPKDTRFKIQDDKIIQLQSNEDYAHQRGVYIQKKF